MKVCVGTTNPAKISAVQLALEPMKLEGTLQVESVSCTSGVSPQPIGIEETMRGAQNRARAALDAAKDADYGIGLEGGIEKVGDQWFECGWICIVHRESGKVSYGSTARVLLAPQLVEPMLKGVELGVLMDAMTYVRYCIDCLLCSSMPLLSPKL
jgi:inosine/xanthosine triphosphatase